MDSFWKSEHDIEAYLLRIRSDIESICHTSNEDWQKFSTKLECEKYKKRDRIIKVGNEENYMYFLVKGAVMLVYPRNGMDYVIRFNFPGSFFNSYHSFISQEPSELKIEAVNDVIVFRIGRADLDNFYRGSEEARMVGQRILETYHFQKEQREIAFLTKSAEENYIELVQNDPELQNYIPLKYTASYLGVAPESLSRIRKKLATRSRIRMSV